MLYSKPQDEVLLELLGSGKELRPPTGNYLRPYIHEEGLLYPSVDSNVGGKICSFVSKERVPWTVVTW